MTLSWKLRETSKKLSEGWGWFLPASAQVLDCCVLGSKSWNGNDTSYHNYMFHIHNIIHCYKMMNSKYWFALKTNCCQVWVTRVNTHGTHQLHVSPSPYLRRPPWGKWSSPASHPSVQRALVVDSKGTTSIWSSSVHFIEFHSTSMRFYIIRIKNFQLI